MTAVDITGYPVQFGGSFGARRNTHREYDRTGVHALGCLSHDRQQVVCSIFEVQHGQRRHSAGVGADIAHHQQRSGLRHAGKNSAFVIEVDRYLGCDAVGQSRARRRRKSCRAGKCGHGECNDQSSILRIPECQCSRSCGESEMTASIVDQIDERKCFHSISVAQQPRHLP